MWDGWHQRQAARLRRRGENDQRASVGERAASEREAGVDPIEERVFERFERAVEDFQTGPSGQAEQARYGRQHQGADAMLGAHLC